MVSTNRSIYRNIRIVNLNGWFEFKCNFNLIILEMKLHVRALLLLLLSQCKQLQHPMGITKLPDMHISLQSRAKPYELLDHDKSGVLAAFPTSMVIPNPTVINLDSKLTAEINSKSGSWSHVSPNLFQG